MITSLEIKNFKSIKHLELACKRVNLFIGRPNTGKSNLLESVGIFSLPYVNGNLKDLIRFENMTNLFYDQDLSEKVDVIAGDSSIELEYDGGKFRLGQEDKDGNCKLRFDYDYAGKSNQIESQGEFRTWPFKFYKFSLLDRFAGTALDFLLPPSGNNLLQILLTNKELKKAAADLLKEFGLRIVLKPQEHKIEVQKEIDDVIISYPYSLISDTLQRVVFHSAAIDTNKHSIIILEEPEAHAFPYYTKFFAEQISLDSSNQFFISTHNPYLLISVLEKTPKAEVGIFITYFKDYQTLVHPLNENELPEILDLDASVFFNLNRFLGDE